MYQGIQIIAEVKTDSPFGFKSNQNWNDLFKIANEVGDIISIHTDSKWNGSFDLVRNARKLTDKPILAKGIHAKDEDIKKAIESGADYVLVVGRIPRVCLDKCLIEPLSLKQLNEIPKNAKVIWNSRDLKNGEMKKESFEDARKIWKGWLCQASNIKSIADIKKGADAVLVGSYLEEFAKSMKKT
jgi:indole-3-glycerol phosphate synthase